MPQRAPPATEALRLEVITWMAMTGFGCRNAARHFSNRGVTVSMARSWQKWAQRNKHWPPPGVILAPRKRGFDTRAKPEAEKPTPRARPVPVEDLEPSVRRRLVKIRDQTLDRLEELSESLRPYGGREFQSYAGGLKTLVGHFAGLASLDEETEGPAERERRRARLREALKG